MVEGGHAKDTNLSVHSNMSLILGGSGRGMPIEEGSQLFLITHRPSLADRTSSHPTPPLKYTHTF